MKTRQHHIDLLSDATPVEVDIHTRRVVQEEMVQDHAYMLQISTMDLAFMHWVEIGFAALFAKKYILKKVDQK